MKRQILTILILLFPILSLKAQIYGTVEGSSGSNNVGIGSSLPTQRLTVDINESSSNAGVPADIGTTQNGIMRLQVNGNKWGETLDFGMNECHHMAGYKQRIELILQLIMIYR